MTTFNVDPLQDPGVFRSPQDTELGDLVNAIHSAAHMGRQPAGWVTICEMVALLSLPCAVPGRAPRKGCGNHPQCCASLSTICKP
jgi:hypothetical protein